MNTSVMRHQNLSFIMFFLAMSFSLSLDTSINESNHDISFEPTDSHNIDYYFSEYNHPKYRAANTAKNVSYLNKEEKELIRLQNLVRMNPQLFEKTYIQTYLRLHPKYKNSSYTRSLIKTLRNAKSLPLYLPHRKLTTSALYHAKDMGRIGKVSHVSSDGTKMADRLRNKFGIENNNIGESCSYGYLTAVDIIIALLIDHKVASLGHRKFILSPNFSYVGVAIRPHKTYEINAVLDYGSK